ncbi:MAG: virulence protein RhuM/Fic/DOC family protein [Planctomycetota bacterium]|nr:virulence protein RhuM/Fic/DOC family protein [Planctomycetota bacterium]
MRRNRVLALIPTPHSQLAESRENTPPAHSSRGEVLVYEAAGGEIQVDVRLERDTVWLTQQQMADLFGRDQSVVARHIRNVFREAELLEESNMHFLHIAGSNKPVTFYSLDVIISVGYRVKSSRGTQFRIWATQTLREHLLQGYSLNERRLAERGVEDLQQTIELLSKTLQTRELISDEGRSVLEVVKRYSRTWRLLYDWDEQRLTLSPARPVAPGPAFALAEARATAATLRTELLQRGEAGALFGQERSEALSGSLAAVEQSFDGAPLYPSAQARAAHLLYFVIKDHPFTDGNKRIGALLFLEYLRRHGLLLLPNGRPRLADTAVVAVALLIAESAPVQKELMVRLVMSLLEDPAPS